MVVEIGGEGAVLPGEFEDRPTVLHKLRNEPTLSRIAKYSPRQRHVAADDLFERVGGHFCRNSTPNNGKNTIALATDAAHESGRMQKSSASEAPDPGRHHVGTPGDIMSEHRATSSRNAWATSSESAVIVTHRSAQQRRLPPRARQQRSRSSS
jgi:hypothetical protein